MSLLKFPARNHPQQVGRNGVAEKVDDRETDPAFFQSLEDRFGGFTLDTAASPHNAKCDRYFTRDDDGLAQPWSGERVWCNPPYSGLGDWLTKAWHEWRFSPSGRPELIVMLLPANRTEQAWWQEHVEPYRDRSGSSLKVEFLRGRLRFLINGDTEIRPNARPPFGCCLLIWGDR